VIELIHAALAKFTTEAKLMIPDRIGNDISQMPSKVMSTFWRSETDLLKPAPARTGRRPDYDVGSSEYGFARCWWRPG